MVNLMQIMKEFWRPGLERDNLLKAREMKNNIINE